MIKVFICEDQSLVRQYLADVLRLEEGLIVVGEAADGCQAIERVAELQPDIVLMDIEMPVTDGIEATRAITGRHPNTRVIILTTHGSEQHVVDCLRSGAAGFALKEGGGLNLGQIITRVHAGETYIEPSVASEAVFEHIRMSTGEPHTGEPGLTVP